MVSKFYKILLLIYVLAFIGCSTQKKQLEIASPTSFEKIESQPYGGLVEQKYLVITNKQHLKKVYAQINMIRKPSLPLPIVNFDSESIIALFMGQKNSGGFTVEIDSIIHKKDNSFVIIIKETTTTDMVSMAITLPFSIYKLNTPNPKIKFVKKH